MKKLTSIAVAAAALSFIPQLQAQLSISALSSFSPNSDGWLAPGEGGYSYLGTANNERGMAYGNGELYLVSRSGGNFIRRLDPLTGADLGAPLDVTGISGGTFAVTKIAVATDGAIYVNNLQTAMSASAAFKVYRWANDAAAPTTVFSGNALTGARLGDSTLAVSGSGSSTLLYSGFANSPAIAGNNGYAVIDPTTGTSTAVGFVGTPPNAGDFRLGLTIGPSGQVWGNQGTSALRETSFVGSVGTLLGTGTGLNVGGAERPMSFAVVNGLSLLATISTGDSTVRIYDASNPLSLVLLGSKNNTSGALSANSNATGDVAWGDVTDNGDGTSTAKLYTLSSNQGIQAFSVLVPEPGAGALLGLGLSTLIALRRNRK